MALILAVEPDRRQAAQIAGMLRGRLRTELVIAESAARALDALADRIPDVLLTSPLLSWQDETALAARLRDLGPAAAHVQALTIPILATTPDKPASRRRGVLSVLRRRRTAASTLDGCEPAVFAEQVALYLEQASAERDANVIADPLPLEAITPPLEAVTPAPIEEIPALAAEDAPVAVVELSTPIETDVLQEIERVIAMPLEEALAPTLTAEEIPAPVVEIAQPVEEVAALSVETPLMISPFEETPAVVADESPGLAARLRDVLSVLRRRCTATSTAGGCESAAAPEPVPSAPVTAPELVLHVAVGETRRGDACVAPIGTDDAAIVPIAMPVDNDEPWVAVPLDELCQAPAICAELRDVAPASDDVWVLTPISEMEELFVIPAPAAAVIAPALAAPTPAPEQTEPPAQSTITVHVRDAAPARQPVVRKKAGRPKKQPVQDEWGFFDPDQCGFAALLDKLDEITDDDGAAEKREDTAVRLIAY